MSDDGYEYDNEDDGMRAALERQRKKPSHIDEAVSLLTKSDPSMGDALDRAHESGGKDSFGVVSSLGPSTDAASAMAPSKPYGPVEPPPSEPPSVAPPPEAPPEQPFKPNDFPSMQTSAPKADPKLAALGTLSKFIDAGTFPAIAGLGDEDLAAAQQRDRQQVNRNNFTKAISSGLLRKPYEPDAAPEAPGLLQRRQLADQAQGRQLSAQEKLVAALKGEPGMTPYQQAQLAEQARDNDYRAKHDTELGARHEEDAKRSQDNIDVARQGVEAQRDFNRTMANMSFGERKQEHQDKQERQVQEDAKDLGKNLSEVGAVQTTADRLLKSTEGPSVAGAGLITSHLPGALLSAEGRQNRADMLKLIQWERHATTGVAFSPAEAEEYAKIYGYNGSEEQFKEGARRLAGEVNDIIKKKSAGYSPAAKERYQQQGGAKPEETPAIATPKPPPGAIPPNATNVHQLKSGKWIYTLPDGTVETWSPK